jgi:hypothetical protein
MFAGDLFSMSLMTYSLVIDCVECVIHVLTAGSVVYSIFMYLGFYEKSQETPFTPFHFNIS